MTESSLTPINPEPAGGEADPEEAAPVAESIRNRRQARQAEKRAEQLEQQLQESQTQIESRLEQLAAAEAQRDELADQLTRTQHRQRVEGALREYGVQDAKAAIALLEKDGALPPDAADAEVHAAIEKLVTDRPHLCAPPASPLPPATAAARRKASARSQLASAAEQAARSGHRRDIAHYLRLRRQLATR